MGFVKTDRTFLVRKAKITLECELKHQYYVNGTVLNLSIISRALKELEREVINPHGDTVTTLYGVVPVGITDDREWLVVELNRRGEYRPNEPYWEDFIATVAGELISSLAADAPRRIARIQSSLRLDSDAEFVIMDAEEL